MDQAKLKMMTDCDIMLMIPGRRDPEPYRPLPAGDSADCNHFITEMNSTIRIEMGDIAQEAYERNNLGKVRLTFPPDPDMPRQDTISFDGFAMMTTHKTTKLAILEFYIPDCNDGVQLLECYRNDFMTIQFGSEEPLPEKDFLKKVDLDPYGLKRAAVYAYGTPSEQECIHCLANELTPHDGDVTGLLQERVRNGNRAQYAGARTYASTTTMLEVCNDALKKDFHTRISYQTSEIFYLELLLLRDSSACNISKRLRELREDFHRLDSKAMQGKIHHINSAMSHAAHLYDESLVKWSTVHTSIDLISRDMGIAGIDTRTEQNRLLLVDMSEEVGREEKSKEDHLKKQFLFAITAFGLFETVYKFLNNVAAGSFIYFLAILVVLFAYFIYLHAKKRR